MELTDLHLQETDEQALRNALENHGSRTGIDLSHNGSRVMTFDGVAYHLRNETDTWLEITERMESVLSNARALMPKATQPQVQ